MKRFYAVMMVAIAIAGAGIGIRRACATDKDPPAAMPLDVAVRLDRDLAHIRETNQRIQQAQIEAKPFVDDADDIGHEFKIDWPSYYRGEISVDFKTGKITRPAAVVAAPPPPDMAKAPAVEKKK